MPYIAQTALNRLKVVVIHTLKASLEIYEGGNKMKAVIMTGGKQYYVAEGDVIYVEKLDGNAGDKVTFTEVLVCDGKVGNPYLEGVTVEGKIEKQGKQQKITIFKYKSKDRSNRRKQGHRQPYTKVVIEKIKG